MPFDSRPYTWNALVNCAPDGIYSHSYTMACGRSTTELWVAKEGGRLTRSGYRHYASCAPPKGPSVPPPMPDDHSILLWQINGETGGYWYRWYPPLAWDPAWDAWEPTPPPPSQVRPGYWPYGFGWDRNHPVSVDPRGSSVLSALYAALNLKGRWQEQEQTIWQEGPACVLYAGRAIKCPWPPAEARLLYEAEHADGYRQPIQNLVHYAYVVLRRRWFEAEKYIQSAPEWWNVYHYWVIAADDRTQS